MRFLTGERAMEAVLNALKQVAASLNENPKARYLMEGFTRDIYLVAQDDPVRVRIADGLMYVAKAPIADAGIVVNVKDPSRFLLVIESGLDISHPIAEGAISISRGKVSDLVLFNRILALS
jgi:hypothetical protein